MLGCARGIALKARTIQCFHDRALRSAQASERRAILAGDGQHQGVVAGGPAVGETNLHFLVFLTSERLPRPLGCKSKLGKGAARSLTEAIVGGPFRCDRL